MKKKILKYIDKYAWLRKVLGRQQGSEIVGEVFASFQSHIDKMEKGIALIEEEKVAASNALEQARIDFELKEKALNDQISTLGDAFVNSTKLKTNIANLLK